MKKILFMLGLLALAVALPVAGQAGYVETVYVFQIGDTREGPVTLSWNHFYDGSAFPELGASLTIIAEGIDTGEDDLVYFNGHFLGQLVQQSFYNASFDINPGPGALGFPLTALTTSFFTLDPSWLLVGNNLVEIVVDPANWIMEAEISTLAVCQIPIPGALWLLGSSLVGLAGLRRKNWL